MIVPKLYGRLGNQCFQIAAAIAHARKMGTEWRIPRRTEDMRYWPNYFFYELTHNRRIQSFGVHRQYDEKRHCFDPIPEYDSLILNGYFQSEKYWPTYEEKYAIGDGLGFHCNKKDYIAIHVRRGDYVSDFSDKWPPLSLEYYGIGISFFLKQGFSKFRIYSDDISWCKKNITKELGACCALQDAMTIEFSNIKDPLADMRDMYNASGFIIANSTFSLFPALLRLDNPVVIAPKEERWFGPGNAHMETFDLMPERFIKI
jgi:hypothetical protein